MVHILTKPKNAITKQYVTLLKMDGVDIKFDTPSLKTIARIANLRKVGARALRGIFEELMLDIMFDAPSAKTKSVTISKKVVETYAKKSLSKALFAKLTAK